MAPMPPMRSSSSSSRQPHPQRRLPRRPGSRFGSPGPLRLPPLRPRQHRNRRRRLARSRRPQRRRPPKPPPSNSARNTGRNRPPTPVMFAASRFAQSACSSLATFVPSIARVRRNNAASGFLFTKGRSLSHRQKNGGKRNLSWRESSRRCTDDDFELPPPQFQAAGDAIWVAAGDRILRLERQTGKQKSEVPLKERVRDIEFADASIMVITEDQTKQKSITHISLPSGAAKTEVLASLPPPRVAPGRLAARLAPPPRGLGADEGPGAGDMGDFLPSAKEFQPAGANVAQFKSTLLEKRLVAVQAMKAAPAESTLNSGNLSARDSMKATGEMLNEMQ